MAMAEVVWEDQPGNWRGAFAKIEDTSRSGACIRVGVPIDVGAKLRIKSHKEHFSAIAKYCRRDGSEYLLGVQRVTPESEAPRKLLPAQAAALVGVPSPARIDGTPPLPEIKLQESPITNPLPAPAPNPAQTVASPVAEETAAAPKAASERVTANNGKAAGDPGPAQSKEPDPPQGSEHFTREPSQGRERTSMLTKFLHLGSSRREKNAEGGNGDNAKTQSSSPSAKMAPEAPMNTTTRPLAIPPNQGRLLSLQDIYLAVGIMSPRHGYSINTVSAMLESGYLLGMSNEFKRASVLMALEAAGISAAELLKDGTQRLDALNAYEVNERKLSAEYEERKAQENSQVQLEMERINAHFLERIEQNNSEVGASKAAFLNWQRTKQKEAQRISDVVDLLTKSPAVDLREDSKPALQEVGAHSKQ
jgi:hypothetical protein